MNRRLPPTMSRRLRALLLTVPFLAVAVPAHSLAQTFRTDDPVVQRMWELGMDGSQTRELGGYIWSYIGDADRFPPPPLEDEVPEELSNPVHFIWFRLPTDHWRTSWLVAIDGGDAYHAVMLHADSHAVSRDEAWIGGNVRKANVPVADRRMKILETGHGIRAIAVNGAGEPVHHGHFTNQKLLGERFILPCISSNPIRPVPGVEQA